jgi:sugar/nucleoside kinase (ribokinase family)
MSLLVTGTIGIDTVETPLGKADDVLGGSAVYFSFAASLVSPVRLVGVVGGDFPAAFREMFKGKPIDVSGLETRQTSKTFRWQGKYVGDMNSAQTLRTDLNVISEAAPKIPETFRDSKFVFLANTHPAIQREFISQIASPKLLVCDTMNLWIETAKDDLKKTLKLVDGVVLNDGEARMLTGQRDLFHAAQQVLELGPKFVVIKKGEHGSVLMTEAELFVLPAFPTSKVKDPTGAGDSFAGGMMGHLAALDRTDMAAMRSAIAVGTCAASITIEEFSLGSIRSATRKTLDERLAALRKVFHFD